MHKFTLALLLAAFAAASSAQAAERYALVVGIDDYQALGKLKTCRADAKALAKVLAERCGFPQDNIVLLTDDQKERRNVPTWGTLKAAIKQMATLPEKDDTVLIFFSGHGITVKGKGYLVPQDGDATGGVALSWLKGQLKQCKAKTKFLILDACHAGSAAKGVGSIAPDLAKIGGGVVMMLSSKAGQVSYPDEKSGHSVFSRYLIDGLSGAADADKNKTITHAELFAYVKKNVTKWCFKTRKTQTPVLFGQAARPLALAKVIEGKPVVLPVPTSRVPNIQDADKAFLARNKKKKGVVTTQSGLQYMILRIGKGPSPTIKSSVTVHYVGRLIDGSEFDSSYKRGQPAMFPVKGVIKGWQEGLQQMQAGGKYRLFVPSKLAYGERGAGKVIGPNATLIFDVELLKIGRGEWVNVEKAREERKESPKFGLDVRRARKYTVQAGDSPTLIAREQLGDPMKWKEIVQLNGIKKPYVLRVGQVLKMPATNSKHRAANSAGGGKSRTSNGTSAGESREMVRITATLSVPERIGLVVTVDGSPVVNKYLFDQKESRLSRVVKLTHGVHKVAARWVDEKGRVKHLTPISITVPRQKQITVGTSMVVE